MAKNKTLSTLSLVMINVIAIDNLRSIPFSAQLGMSLICYYILAALLFFIPTALVTAELATAWPNKGGVYIWVREAFGELAGLITIWLQWIYNVVWYPTILTFIAANLAHIFQPDLASNNIYTWLMISITFWLCTIINYSGMRISSVISTIGATIGTLMPMLIIISFGAIWLWQGNDIAISTATKAYLPDLGDSHNLYLFSMIVFGLMGIEMSAVHADEVENPRKAYPRSILYSAIIIFISLILSNIAVAIVVKPNMLSFTSGIAQAFQIFLIKYKAAYLVPWMIMFVIIGSLSSVVTWIIGPTKGLLVASQDGSLPRWFGKINSKEVPTNILLLQTIIFMMLSFCYVVIPNVEGTYEILSILTTQLALIVYILMFASSIVLYNKGNSHSFQIPGGKIGSILVNSLGIITCLAIILIGLFITPPHISYNGIWYAAAMAIALLIFIAPPFVMYYFVKKS